MTPPLLRAFWAGRRDESRKLGGGGPRFAPKSQKNFITMDHLIGGCTSSLFFILVRVELLIAQAVRSQVPECDPAHKYAAPSEACSVRVDHNSRVFMFTDAPYPAAEIRSAAIISFPRKRKSLFARVLDALHHSRRIQARHVVRRYHHLISYGDRLESARSDDLDR